MQVLNRHYFCFGVFRAPLKDVVRAFDTYSPMRVASRETPFVLPEQGIYKPATQDDAPSILWTPASSPGLTAFMPGADQPGYVQEYATARFRFDAVSARSQAGPADWIDEFITHKNGSMERGIRAMDEDVPGNRFWLHGDALPFEDIARYKARRIRDRFQRAHLIEYVQAWGASVDLPGFWETQATAFTFTARYTGLLEGWTRPRLAMRVDAAAWARWQGVTRRLEDALQLVAPDIPTPEARSIRDEFSDHLLHDRLVEALDLVAALAISHRCRAAFWKNLQGAAGCLGLPDRAIEFQQRFEVALDARHAPTTP